MITKDELLRRKELYKKGELPRKELTPKKTIKEKPKKEPIVRSKRGSPEFRAKVSAGMKKARQEHPEKWANRTWSSPGRRAKLKGRSVWNQKAVRCIELDRVFKSMSQASDFCREQGASKRALGYALSGKKETAAGYHWEFVDKE